ncbi:peptidase M28 [Mucilaginibacter hurinus]|uniref:Peptidase M28 n=1 Tax=Mucilaginibacter hurinus TaxID=2201324 RepID=A0A367GNG4_9SPHI|nr:M20/M25/M40 family metallo-hydrolase [Mucilaginibacter hurinus]RCH55017.1 peptidase M28 [Mucilaginibacter hurinus]
MIKKLICAAYFVAAAAIANAQNVNQLINKADVSRIIQKLSADDMEGRGSFTAGIEKAATFIAKEFKAAGLKPLPAEANFRQSFHVIQSTPLSTRVTINGSAINPDNAIAFAGDSFTWDNTAGVEIVTVKPGDNFRKIFGDYYRSNKKALLMVDTSFADVFKRIKQHFSHGSVSFDNPGAKQVVMVLGKFQDVTRYTVRYEAKVENKPLFNVAGMIKGKTRPQEFVIFSGHYDHLGIVKGKDILAGDSIANGADDDASGTTAVIALAKYYKKLNNNARTLIFVAFTAEEIGGFGSQYFSKKVDPDKTVAMFNIEMIGKPSKFGKNSAFITGYDRSNFGAILQKNLKGTAFKFHPDPYPEQNLFYRSDNATLARLGVPAHTISTDEIDIDKYYHTVNDEFATLNVDNIVATIRAIALSSKSIVAAKDSPTRIPKLLDDK